MWHCKAYFLELTGSPFIQEIAELTSPTAEGPGLKKGVVAEPCDFTIDARGFPGDVTIDVEGTVGIQKYFKIWATSSLLFIFPYGTKLLDCLKYFFCGN